MSVAVGDKVMLPEYGGSKIELEDKVRITWRGLVYNSSLPQNETISKTLPEPLPTNIHTH